ncbi:hypothetical protein CDL12_23158 [Handroanthus impetiginosus]|uniref:Uncharacterized protein n=1 Tax=Handroanthus impetiginosus TaxID=429701 RepID=A0A2G9GG83_9LAMI|nr:hypothetical protein CDL12_23158 [Handroanthus impetiginosus]
MNECEPLIRDEFDHKNDPHDSRNSPTLVNIQDNPVTNYSTSTIILNLEGKKKEKKEKTLNHT